MASALGIAYSTSTSSATTHYSSAVSLNGTPLSPRSEYSAASSSGSLVGDSLEAADDGKDFPAFYEEIRYSMGAENATITFNRLPSSSGAGRSEQPSSEDSE